MKSAKTSAPAPVWRDIDFTAFNAGYREYPELQLATDVGCVGFPKGYFETARVRGLLARAFDHMARLEAGEKVNRDELDDQGQPGRMVGHYWLRAPELAPKDKPELAEAIRATLTSVKRFSRSVLAGRLTGQKGRFKNLLVIGIGGSALGPQFVARALGGNRAGALRPWFFDNTDPDGMDRVLAEVGRDAASLGVTLCVVISKSGTTPETKNGLEEAKAAYAAAGLQFGKHAVAITQVGSRLDRDAAEADWLARFPMWDWVGGRTSVTSTVGLLPAALQGTDIDALLAGAAACDRLTRQPDGANNPAALLALVWYFCGRGHGTKDLVVIPYKDRLELFSRYLQQLIMESLGKELDATNRQVVNQGLAVYGNKGSTDQHAYVQQLREGLNNFFAIFIEVLKDREGPSLTVAPELGATSGDFLAGFLLGTRKALKEKNRASMTITVDEVSPFTVGVLIALFERAVGLYASFIGINAYHQPGVEAGKKAATEVLKIQQAVVTHFARLREAKRSVKATATAIAQAIGQPDAAETVFKICQRLSVNGGRGLRRVGGSTPADIEFAPEPSGAR
jgi:glucose-6-phosphate isomerase